MVADLPGDDLILCQITSQARPDPLSIPLTKSDLDRGQLAVDSFARAGRLFTVQYSVILYTAAHAKQAKLDEVRAAIRRLFS